MISPDYVICQRFLWRKRGKSNYQNGYYGDGMETVWREILVMVKLVWRFSGGFIEKIW